MEIENIYDKLDRIVQIKYNGVIRYKYTYNGNGDLCRIEDALNDITYHYEYDNYLQSRYYDPAIQRFINADGYVNANGESLALCLALNLYQIFKTLATDNLGKRENEKGGCASMIDLEFVLWILHIISALISIVTIVAGWYDLYIVDWFEEWVEKNKISLFVEKLVIWIGIISIMIAFVTGMILETIVVK